MTNVVCFGELIVDMVGATGASLADSERFLKAPGGAPANVAAGLARLGTPSQFIGQVGDDPFGQWLRATLDAERVGTDFLRSSRNARTTIAFIATRQDGRKDICFYRNPGADAQFSGVDFDDRALDSAQIFHCGSVSLSLEPCRSAQLHAARQARKRGLLISYDPNWRPSLWEDHQEARAVIWEMMELADVVKIADEEWEFVTGTEDFWEGARAIRARGPQLVVLTRGAKGAAFECEAARGEVDGFTAKAIDTLGAGDAFVAGFLTHLGQHISPQSTLDAVLNEQMLQEMTRFANACGALATQKSGAIPSLPTRDEVDLFLQSR